MCINIECLSNSHPYFIFDNSQLVQITDNSFDNAKSTGIKQLNKAAKIVVSNPL